MHGPDGTAWLSAVVMGSGRRVSSGIVKSFGAADECRSKEGRTRLMHKPKFCRMLRTITKAWRCPGLGTYTAVFAGSMQGKVTSGVRDALAGVREGGRTGGRVAGAKEGEKGAGCWWTLATEVSAPRTLPRTRASSPSTIGSSSTHPRRARCKSVFYVHANAHSVTRLLRRIIQVGTSSL